jgi:hypothetical protein
VSYYANSIGHLLGPFTAAVKARDALPAMAAMQPSDAVPTEAQRK